MGAADITIARPANITATDHLAKRKLGTRTAARFAMAAMDATTVAWMSGQDCDDQREVIA